MERRRDRRGVLGLFALAALGFAAMPAWSADRVVVTEEFTSTS